MKRSMWLAGVAVLCVAAILYFHAFGDAPVYLGGDEARFATEAASIAASGRDLNGDRLPLFVHMADSIAANDGSTRWYQPVLFYLIALVLKFVPRAYGPGRTARPAAHLRRGAAAVPQRGLRRAGGGGAGVEPGAPYLQPPGARLHLPRAVRARMARMPDGVS